MSETTAIVASASGLHARPASMFVETAQRHDAEITIRLDDGPAVNAKSILLVMSLGAKQGSTVHLLAEGSDSDAALAELQQLIETDFDS